MHLQDEDGHLYNFPFNVSSEVFFDRKKVPSSTIHRQPR